MNGRVLRLVGGREKRKLAMQERMAAWVTSALEDDPEYPAEVQGAVLLGYYADGRRFLAAKIDNTPGLWSEQRIILEAEEAVRQALANQEQ